MTVALPEHEPLTSLCAEFAASLYEAVGTDEARPLALHPPSVSGTNFEAVARTFGLSPFEQMVLFMALCMQVRPGLMLRACAVELELYETHQALSAFLCPYVLQQWLPDVDLTAFAPQAPLLSAGLIRLTAGSFAPGNPLMASIELAPGALGFIRGVPELSSEAQDFVFPVGQGAWLGASQQQAAQEVLELLDGAQAVGEVPVINLYGPSLEAALEVCQALPRDTLALYSLELDLVARLLRQRRATVEQMLSSVHRDMTLLAAVLVVQMPVRALQGGEENTELADSGWSDIHFVQHLCARSRTPVVLISQDPLGFDLPGPMYGVPVEKALPEEQAAFWAQALGLGAVQARRPDFEGALMQVATQFSFGSRKIHDVATEVRRSLGETPPPPDLVRALWEACRRQGRKAFQGVAEQIRSAASWDRLVLPPDDLQTLRDIVVQVQHRHEVYKAWNYGGQERGLGITVLFSGTSGGGKTFAAEVLARELGLDLYRIDLSSVTSKWIGETEKNLKKVFDAADEGGAILLFDEADSVFGKRGDVQSSNDRYANLTTNYLLQRMEAYRGLAILTTNFEGNIDSAFTRRIRFTVRFREPDAALRQQLWARAFPAGVEVAALDHAALARTKLTGAHIRAIALNATFLAAARKTPVDMALLQEALSRELTRQGKLTLSGSE